MPWYWFPWHLLTSTSMYNLYLNLLKKWHGHSHGGSSGSYALDTSPIGLIPKARQMGRWRMIVDLSCPPASSVNNGLTPLYHLFVMHQLTMQLKLFAAWVRGFFSRSLTSRMPIELFQSTHLITTGWGSCGMGLHMWIDASHLAHDQPRRYFLPSLMLWHGSLDVLGL